MKTAELRRQAAQRQRAADYEAHIQSMVDAMSPPTPEQIAALTAIFGHSAPARRVSR